MFRFLLIAFLGLSLSACATVAPTPVTVSAAPSRAAAVAAQAQSALPAVPSLKRKIAIGRFTNATNYGRALLLPNEQDPMSNQISDMLMARLVNTGRFMVFERSDLDAVMNERDLQGNGGTNPLVGVDALIVGSLTEFGRRTEGRQGFLSSTLRQSVDASVDVRLVDVDSGLAFFSGSGAGTASTEAGEVAGFGNRAGYDATLNDQALAAAVDDLVSDLIRRLSARPWHTDILAVRGGQVFVSGGSRQGLQIGDRFSVMRAGETITSAQTGMPITLPGTQVAVIEVLEFFGEDEFSEGSIARVVSGSLGNSSSVSDLEVRELR